MAALGGRVADQVRYQFQNVIGVPDVGKGVIAMAAPHIDQIQYAHVIPLFLEQMARIPANLPLGVQDHQGGIALHGVGLGIEAGLACAAAAHHNGVEISPVLAAVEAHTDMPGKQLVVHWLRTIRIVAAQGPGIAPAGGAVFLQPPVVFPGGSVNQ